MSRSKAIITILLFLKTITISAQEINVTGAIKDSLANLTLQGAEVTIKGMETVPFSKIILTDKEGIFKLALPKPGFYTIGVTFIGYKAHTQDTVLFDESHLSAPTILMLPDHTNLQAVTVTTKKPFIVMGTNIITLNVAQSP